MRRRTSREVWRTIPLFEAYQVSNHGRVRRVARGANGAPPKILKPWVGVGGERYVSLRADGHTHTSVVDALVEIAFRRHSRASAARAGQA